MAHVDDSGSPLRWDGEDLIVRVHLQPKASRDEIVGMHGGALKVRVMAPPLEGRANASLIGLLAAAFGIPRSRVTLEHGASGREKSLRLIRPGRIPARLLHLTP